MNRVGGRGPALDKREQKWEEWLARAAEYRRTHGDLLVPRCYVTRDGKKLGRWIERQRAAYQGKGTYRLDMDRIQRLESLDMAWSLEIRTDTDEWLRLAREYRERFGNLLVPKSYMVRGVGLGEWISMQRKLYRQGKLPEERRAQLEQLDMVWKLTKRTPWMEWYARAETFYREHGHLKIPYHYETQDGMKLGSWLSMQRDSYHNSWERWSQGKGRKPLAQWQIERLNAIGMVRRVNRPRARQELAPRAWEEPAQAANLTPLPQEAPALLAGRHKA